VVNRGALLGGEQRVHGADVGGGEQHDALGARGQRGGPGINLHAVAVIGGLAAETFPATEGHQKLEAGVFCVLRDG